MLLLTSEQARAVMAVLSAPDNTYIELLFNSPDGEIIVTATALCKWATRVEQLLGEAREDYEDGSDFARAYGVVQLPPLICPVETALTMARDAISRMAQRQPGVTYDHSQLWAQFAAARAELKRLKS